MELVVEVWNPGSLNSLLSSATEAEPTKPQEVVNESEPQSTPAEAKKPENAVASVVSKEIERKADSRSLMLTDSTFKCGAGCGCG